MRKIGLCLLISMMLVGCTQLEKGIHIHSDTEEDHQLAESIFAADDRLARVAAIIHEDKLVVGLTVHTFSRFHKEKIEAELKKKLEEAYPDLEVTVSADNKIVHKTAEIIQNTNKENLEEQLDKIVSLLKEET